MPLADLTVLDLSIARSGPAAARQFADWGANVIRIEPSERVDALAPDDSDYLNLHRGKRAMTLNLKSDAGLEVFFRLVERADVLIENFRPPVKVALSIDYPTVAARNPRLVYGSISGYGQSGPYSAKGALDQIIQGIGGLMSVTGHPGSGPLRAGIAVADLAAGHHLAFGILAALHERERSGLGQWVQVSLLESLITMLDFQAARWTIDGELPGQVGNDHPNRMPIGMYPASDGDINLAAYSDRLWERLCDALEEPSLAHDERFASAGLRVTNRGALNAQISAITRTRPRSEWLARLDAHGIPAWPDLFDSGNVRRPAGGLAGDDYLPRSSPARSGRGDPIRGHHEPDAVPRESCRAVAWATSGGDPDRTRHRARRSQGSRGSRGVLSATANGSAHNRSDRRRHRQQLLVGVDRGGARRDARRFVAPVVVGRSDGHEPQIGGQ